VLAAATGVAVLRVEERALPVPVAAVKASK
jgi:hypothetical protein